MKRIQLYQAKASLETKIYTSKAPLYLLGSSTCISNSGNSGDFLPLSYDMRYLLFKSMLEDESWALSNL